MTVCLAAGIYRLYCGGSDTEATSAGIAQTTGSQEIQADRAYVTESSAGILAVLADGIGKENRGQLCAQLALDAVLDQYEPYHILSHPDYFFRTAFHDANRRIQVTMGERYGGASLGSIFTDGVSLTYALAGNIRIGLLRRGELIPLSKGQTVDVLAADAWRDGKITRREALWSMEEKRLWNYVGMDGFREIEQCERPIRLKDGDMIFMASKGVFEELSWGEMEDILVRGKNVRETAREVIRAVEAKENPEKDNGSVVLLRVRTDQNEKD